MSSRKNQPNPPGQASASACARIPSSRLLDSSNGATPNAAHQALPDDNQARLKSVGAISKLVKNIEDLSLLLPASVAEATKADEIYRVITPVPGHDPPSVVSTFNRRFDILFKEDQQCRDENGRLHLIRRGELGMLFAARYLREIKWNAPEMDLDGAKIKLERIVKEMEILSGSSASDAKGKAAALRKSTATLSKPKTTPGNTKSTAAATNAEPEKDAFFDRIMAGRKGKTDGRLYKPKKQLAPLSEEEEDDELGDEAADPASSSATRKRKVIVVDGVVDAPPKKRVKKPTAPAPTVEVIEIDDETPDAVPSTGETGKRGPKSSTRDHFLPPVATHNRDSEKRWSFKCRHCSTCISFERTVSKNALFGDQKPQPALGNLSTHITRHHQGVSLPSHVQPGEARDISASSAKIMEGFLVDGKLNPAINTTQKNFLKIFSAWIVEDDLPWSTGETPGINRLFEFLHTRYAIIKSELVSVKSKIAMSNDTWTTRAMTFTFAGSIASWITSDWELVERVIDFHPIEDKEQEGEYAAIGLAKRLAELDILEKTITLDNAAPNDVLVRALSTSLRKNFDIQFHPENSQIRCLAHVVNLVVQKILVAIDEADDPGTKDDYIPNKDLPIHYDPDDDDDLNQMEQETFPEPATPEAVAAEATAENDEDAAGDLLSVLGPKFAKLSPLQKLRTTVTKICSSPQRRKRFRAQAQKAYKHERAESGREVASLMVVRDVRHRWNYTHAMIKRARVLRKAIDSWVLEREETRPLILSNEDWTLLGAIEDMLQPFTQVTLKMSQSTVPTLPWVLPMYEAMLKHLGRYQNDMATDLRLCLTAAAGLEKLQTYHSKARGCQLNIIATLLHPCFGIAWFQKLDAENAEQDIDSTRTHEAEVIFEHAYDSYKQLHDAEKNTSAPKAIKKHVSRPGTFNSFLDDVCMVGVAAPARPTTVASEWERFRTAFDTYGGGAGGSPLVWWKEHEPEYPIVAKMARDFLAIPGTSVSVERLFSKSRHLCHESRGSLHAKTIMEAMLTKMWIKAGLLKPGLLDCGRG